MRAVNRKRLKKKLDEYVRIAAGGETVLVTHRGRVVAELVPPGDRRAPIVADAMLVDAVRQGWITPPALMSDTLPPRKPVMTFRELMSELDRSR